MNITYITCFTIVLIRIVNLNHNEMLFLIKKTKISTILCSLYYQTTTYIFTQYITVEKRDQIEKQKINQE
jgi:hypothetical protein